MKYRTEQNKALLKRKDQSSRTRSIAISFTWVFVVLMIVLPILAICIDALSKGSLLFFETLFSDTVSIALFYSIVVTIISVLFSMVFGFCAAWCIAYFKFPGRRLLVSLIDLPISVSPIIIGLMFLLIYGKYGFLGQYLEDFGFVVVFAFPSLILTNISITLPYVARTLIPAMQELGKKEEEMGYMLGANGFQLLFRITLPRVKWALLYGMILATARGAGEFGAASVVSGFIRGKTVTLPLQVHIFYSEYLSTQAYISATLFLLLSIGTVIAKQIVGKQGLKKRRRKT